MPAATVSAIEVQARWAYSEITNGTLAHQYDGREGIADLRARHQAGVPFEVLSDGERFCLAYQCIAVRPALFCAYMSSVRMFRRVPIRKAALGTLLVAPQVAWDELQGKPEPFRDFVRRPPPARPQDCRNVQEPDGGYRAPADPIALGVSNNARFLVDGYHRAVAFWKWSPEAQTIEAFVPHRRRDVRLALAISRPDQTP